MTHLTRRRLLKIAALASATPTLPSLAQPTYPARPVTLIVAYPPGGPNDISARVVTQPLTTYWNFPVIVDNRAGAGGAIGAQFVARAQPDGYTLLLLSINHTILPSLKPGLPYKLLNDFTPVGLVAMYPIVLVAHPSLPVKSVRELIEYARARPGELTFGSSGVGGGEHMAGELFCTQTGIKMLHVAYKGSAPAINDLLGGQIQVMFGAAPSIVPHVKSGRVRGLAVSSNGRFAGMPELATFSEAGLREYQANSWTGVVAPAGTPSAIVENINAALRSSLSQPSVKARLLEVGAEVMPGTPEEFGKFIAEEQSKWASIIKQNGIKTD